MSNYYEIYDQRLNRYGRDYQSRVAGQRQKVFDNLLLKSIYRIDFKYGNDYEAAILEPYKQDDTKTLQYLLTRLDTELAPGAIIEVESEEEEVTRWMIYYLEDNMSRGYNRYIVLKMSHYITWLDRNKVTRSTWCYFYGKQTDVISDALKSGGKTVVYEEDQTTNSIIMPVNEYLRKDDYFEINDGEMLEGYKVKGYDRISTKGVEYVTVESDYIKDKSPIPKRQSGESKDDYYWFNGGEN